MKTKLHKKKKRISKHVLEAEEKKRQKLEKGEGGEINEGKIGGDAERKGANTNKSKRAVAKKVVKIKDPKEVEAYLSAWKDDRSSWKYNKNTQSWMLRHLYDGEKVSKTTFSIVLEYLQSIKGETTISRVTQDAIRRAMRYKNFLKNVQQQPQDDKGNEHDIQNNSINRLSSKDPVTATNSTPLLSMEEQQVDTLRWMALDEHQKRKEYKRARKILDTLKELEMLGQC